MRTPAACPLTRDASSTVSVRPASERERRWIDLGQVRMQLIKYSSYSMTHFNQCEHTYSEFSWSALALKRRKCWHMCWRVRLCKCVRAYLGVCLRAKNLLLTFKTAWPFFAKWTGTELHAKCFGKGRVDERIQNGIQE